MPQCIIYLCHLVVYLVNKKVLQGVMEKPAHLIVFDHKIFDPEDSAFEGLKIGLRQTKLAKNATCIG